ncbi:alpha/beta fold hydrolase [Paraburkholderia sp. BL25I1N1]|uniref:alpha/beta fold hydrolase n=1 Tax=Paraburkholderia sp. BL25I1N1 TaxID=1938804 RepID=UPI000D081860|nr:alpha/beta hydrolase [Paraburkholderia sp. BL25I1N1]
MHAIDRQPGTDSPFRTNQIETPRHRTVWIEAGPKDGPLMIFVHGWPELSIMWRKQLEHFAGAGWRCVAPDMRGYGKSSLPTSVDAYAMREIVADMLEMHGALGSRPAVWIGHDLGSPVVSGMATHHPDHCRAIVNISVPYFPNAFALPSLLPLVDRRLYPEDQFPFGQWDYYQFYLEQFNQATTDYEADVSSFFSVMFRPGSPEVVGKPSPTASVRARGGLFGAAHRAPNVPRVPTMMSKQDFDTFVREFNANGFFGPNAWYLNDAANIAFAGTSPDAGRLKTPVLFINGLWDSICDISRNRLGDPMRAACSDLRVVSLEGAHWLPLEKPEQVNGAISTWLSDKRLAA